MTERMIDSKDYKTDFTHFQTQLYQDDEGYHADLLTEPGGVTKLEMLDPDAPKELRDQIKPMQWAACYPTEAEARKGFETLCQHAFAAALAQGFQQLQHGEVDHAVVETKGVFKL